jgi:hypothetical protein
LLGASEEFTAIWSDHEVGLQHRDLKRIQNAQVGVLELHCQALYDQDQTQALLVFTATPGTESHDKLALLSVIGTQDVTTDR